ncbi:hypothetical protein AMK59_3036, partial [Oryctes borbonicus]
MDLMEKHFTSTIRRELNELEGISGINIWSQEQSILEGQALNEIEIFTSNNRENTELSKEESEITPILPTKKDTLDINKYIQQQEELKRKLDYKRASRVSEKSKNAANRVQLNIPKKRKNKKETVTKPKRIKLTENKNKEIQIEENEASGSEYFPSDLENEESDWEPGGNSSNTRNRKSRST